VIKRLNRLHQFSKNKIDTKTLNKVDKREMYHEFGMNAHDEVNAFVELKTRNLELLKTGAHSKCLVLTWHATDKDRKADCLRRLSWWRKWRATDNVVSVLSLLIAMP
jgi:hypothetical protein